jgi:hypothetical protein
MKFYRQVAITPFAIDAAKASLAKPQWQYADAS